MWLPAVPEPPARPGAPAQRPPEGLGLLRPAEWLHGELFDRRLVFIRGRLDTDQAVRAAAELMTMDASGTDPVDVYIDSSEGTVEAAFVLIDTLDLLQAPTHMHALGEVGGTALGVLTVGRRRTAAPHARFVLAEPSVQISGTASQLASHGEQQQMLLRRFRERLARATGRDVAEIVRDMAEGRYFDAQEALAYGLIDEVADPRRPASA